MTGTCHLCRCALGSSPSDDFCGQMCFRLWHAARCDPLPVEPFLDQVTDYVATVNRVFRGVRIRGGEDRW